MSALPQTFQLNTAQALQKFYKRLLDGEKLNTSMGLIRMSPQGDIELGIATRLSAPTFVRITPSMSEVAELAAQTWQ